MLATAGAGGGVVWGVPWLALEGVLSAFLVLPTGAAAANTAGSGVAGETETGSDTGSSGVKDITKVEGSEAVGVAAFGARSGLDGKADASAGSPSQPANKLPKKKPTTPAVKIRITVMTSGDMS